MELFSTVLNLFISDAHAETAAPAAAPAGNFSMIIMLVFFVVFMYLVVWRPQSKRAKEQRDLLNSLAQGDEVMTAGGILGKITKVSDKYVAIALNDSVEIKMQKTSVISVLPKGTLKSI